MTWLLQALQSDPVVNDRLVIVAGWETRTRNYGQSTKRDYIVCHHTASPTTMKPSSELAVIINGNSVAPGPIAPILITREPKVYLVARGDATCNHCGAGTFPDGSSGNARAVGIEVSNNGVGEFWSNYQVELYARTVAAICRNRKWGTNRIVHHWTYAPKRKVDPKGPASWNGGSSASWSIEQWRQHVGLYVLPPPQPPSVPTEEAAQLFAIARPRGYWDTGIIGPVPEGQSRHLTDPAKAQLLVDSFLVMDLAGKIVPAGTNYNSVTRVIEDAGLFTTLTGITPGTPTDPPGQ